MEVTHSLLIRWFLTVITASLIYGNLSVLVAARRLYFLSAVTPHSALLAALISVVISNVTGVHNDFLWSVLISCFLMLCVGYFTNKGYSTDIVTSAYVALTASLSVTIMNYVLTSFRVNYSLWSVILGDPLLTTWDDLFLASLIAPLTITLTFLSLKYHLYAGVDLDYVKLVGMHSRLYDYIFFLLLGVASVALIKVTGLILQHVLILLPSIIAVRLAESCRMAYAASLTVSILSGVLGLQIAILINISPSGMVGLTLIVIYIISLVLVRTRGGGLS